MPPPQGSRSTSSASAAVWASGGREHRGPGAAAASDDRDHLTAAAVRRAPTPRPRRARATRSCSCCGHPQHALGADSDRRRPCRRVGFGAGQNADVGAPRQRDLAAPPVAAAWSSTHRRSRRPGLPAHRIPPAERAPTRTPTAAATRSSSSRSRGPPASPAPGPGQHRADAPVEVRSSTPPCGRVRIGHQCQSRICGERPICGQAARWAPAGPGTQRNPRNAWAAASDIRDDGRFLPQKKGRPPPGGEEAEVVVYQPRGVGLIHTRHKPSNAYYTHGSPESRKYSTQ